MLEILALKHGALLKILKQLILLLGKDEKLQLQPLHGIT